MNSSVFAVLKVGTVFLYPPFVLSPNEGFDIEFIHLVCKELNEPCDIRQMDYNQLFSQLSTGGIDVAIGGISIPINPDTNFIYSLPYTLSRGQFLILNGGPIHSPDDLVGRTVGVLKSSLGGGAFYLYLQDKYANKIQLKTYDDIEDLVTALNSKQIAAVFIHHSTVEYWVQNSSNQFKAMGEPVTIGNGLGIMAIPKNQALIERINEAIRKIEKEDVYLNLYNTYLYL